MRVAHVGNFKPDSANGVDKTVAGLVRYLPAEGVKTEVWHFTPRVNQVTERVVEETTIFDLPVRASRWRNLFPPQPSTRSLLRERSSRVDLVHLHSVFIPQHLWLARLVNAPVVLTPNGGYSPEVLRGRNRALKAVWVPFLERPSANGADAVQAVSPPEVGYLKEFGIRSPIALIPNGVDPALLEQPVPSPSAGTEWVFVGRLAVEHKGLDLLIRGYALLAAEHSDLPPLTLVGPDFRGGQARLERLAGELGVADRVMFPGPVFGDDKWETLGRARVFLHTSRWEGMPFAVLEAMALGRPVLVTSETNLASYLEGSGAGWVLPGDPEAIASGLAEAADNRGAALDELGERARAVVREHFAWPVIAARMAELYTEVTGISTVKS